MKINQENVASGVIADYTSRIQRLRVKYGLTQMRLAEMMGVSFATVNRWENGLSRPSALAWEKIVRAETLGLDALEKGVAAQFPLEHAVAPDVHPTDTADIDFTADPDVIWAVAEGYRLAYGHLVNPSFATETALIEPLPHQRIAVYEHLLPQTRLRFLLADDAGAGKTIMSGLYIQEMLSRRLIRRVLVVPPAGLVGNWERELRTLFSLPFRIVSGGDARAGNPFTGPDSNLVIVSVDTLAGERAFARFQEPSVAPYDLVIFDEAHKLSADREPDFTLRRTDRYRLAEALAGISAEDPRWRLSWIAQHLLLLTATPHMGKDFPYYCLWRLLEPEILSTVGAFNAYPKDARARHFIRRTKEEMVRLDGSPIYPKRVSDTLSYNLTQGDVSEQVLYDRTTAYIQTYYNQARLLNRSAARLAMSVFQRRLASSTFALMRSFERRLNKLDEWIDAIRSGRLSEEELRARQRKLDDSRAAADVLDAKTADEEHAENEREENEVSEDRILEGFVATSLSALEVERREVVALLDLAKQVCDLGEESKFLRMAEVLRDPAYRDEKLIIFTEHRDTLDFLVRRLEGLGFTGKIARIHGGLDFREREEQVEFFRKPQDQGGAAYLVATDAAGEGINLQFCWMMINYDIPWNPARLEQRMGRIHRYGQKRDPVVILNLVSGGTREGRVIRTLLEKLERIRKEMKSDKVFDVVGRLFEGVSIKDYMEKALTEKGADDAQREIEGTLTQKQVEALRGRERNLYGDGGDVRRELHRLHADLDREAYRRLLPGYVRRYLSKAAPRVDIGIEGDLEGFFSLRGLKVGALDPLWPVLEAYPLECRNRLTVSRPRDPAEAVFLHPGEALFDRFHAYVSSRLGESALRGCVFVDPAATRPYIFHLALISIVRQADPALPLFARLEVLQYRLVGLKHEDTGQIVECPVEYPLLLKGARGLPADAGRLAVRGRESAEQARQFALERVARTLVEERRQALLKDLPDREDFLARGFHYQDAELAAARTRLVDRLRGGDPQVQTELVRIKDLQRSLDARRGEALALLRREPELIAPGEIRLLARALVVPSGDEEEKKRHDAEIEAIAVSVVWAFEEAIGAALKDVSKPALARAAGLTDHPGFDILSRRPGAEERAIEVKGRAETGSVELTENEWAKACNLRERYWLYVVYECATSHPHLVRVQDPFGKLLVKARGGVVIVEDAIFAAADPAGR